MEKLPITGLGVIIQNNYGEVLFGKRKGSHAPYYSIPGGKLEKGETFEDGAAREVFEEHGINIQNPRVIAVTNNLQTFRSEGLHSISIILLASSFVGEPVIKEPDKCEDIIWAKPDNLPQPHFEASRLAIECYLTNNFYVGTTE